MAVAAPNALLGGDGVGLDVAGDDGKGAAGLSALLDWPLLDRP